MKNFSKDILHTIEQNRIEPRPRWVFLMRQAALLGGFILSVLVGGLSVSVILLSLADLDWDAPRMMGAHPGPFLVAYLPYVWVALLIVFGIVAYYEMRNTKSGYRYRAATILAASFLASLAVGGILHGFGMGQIAERRFADVIPQYRGLDARKMNLWMRPGDGMLAGTMVSGSATTTFVLEDFAGIRWTVSAIGATQYGTIGTGRVRVIGSVVRPGEFRATEIFPWTRHGMMRDDRGFPNMMGQGGMLFRERNAPAFP
jgi:hypothetical protein